MLLGLPHLWWVFILRNHLLLCGQACTIALLPRTNRRSIISIRSILLFSLKRIQDLVDILDRNLSGLYLQGNPYRMLCYTEGHILLFDGSLAIDIQHKQMSYLQFCRIPNVRNLAYWHILHQSIHFYRTYQTVYPPSPQGLTIFLSWSN